MVKDASPEKDTEPAAPEKWHFVEVQVEVRTDNTGAKSLLPGLLGQYGLVVPLLEYILHHSHDRSIRWMQERVRAAKLFLEYWSANPGERATHVVFTNFAQRLYTGTFDRQSGLDPSGLCWTTKAPSAVRQIIGGLTEFFEYLAKTRPEAGSLNPDVEAGAHDRALEEAAYQHRRSRALLGHTWGAKSTASTRLVRPAREPGRVRPEPPAFPDAALLDLIFKGFQVRGRRDYRGMLITLLLNGAGLRESEPFHLYISDVVPHPTTPGSALVLVHHPVASVAPPDPAIRDRRINREAYLHHRWGILPRTKILGRTRAGWKGGAHEDTFGGLYFEATWFPPELGELFLQLWYKYLYEISELDRRHPYAFVNQHGGELGAPYCLGQFLDAHSAAVERIGLEVSKAAGTTPHGHRHAYGQRLKAAGVAPILIQRFMHHASIESQEDYTGSTREEARNALAEAALRLNSAADRHRAGQVRAAISTLAEGDAFFPKHFEGEK